MKKTIVYKVLNVISYIFIGILFLASIIGIIIKVNNGTIYMFGVRGDVVLTDSMSTKNEKYKEFLEGHNDQIQKMDLVFSKKIEKGEDIEVYDRVLFDNPGIGTTVHRVVGKDIYSEDIFTIRNAQRGQFEENEVVYLPELGSIVETSNISFTEATVIVLSKEEYTSQFSIGANNILLEQNVTKEIINNYFRYTISVHKNSSAPAVFRITYPDYCDFSSFCISSISMNATNGDINVKAESFNEIGDHIYSCSTNKLYLYEIRGDAASDSDGKFKIDQIYSKVTFVVPKLGGLVRFITSVFGIILFVGLGIILLGTSIIYDRISKKENKFETITEKDKNEEEN